MLAETRRRLGCPHCIDPPSGTDHHRFTSPGDQPALVGVERPKAIRLLCSLDHDDSPERRSILRVHRYASPGDPMCGVLPTRAAVRPNLLARSRRRVLSVQDTVNKVDASPDTRVLDIKP